MSKHEPWFCPFCANELSGEIGNLFCEIGATGFSAALVEKFISGRANKLSPHLFENGKSMVWFCPACAHQLNWGIVDNIDVFGCAACGLYLPIKVQHHLLKRHTHSQNK